MMTPANYAIQSSVYFTRKPMATLITTILSLLASGAATGQDSGLMLEEVVVTAQKRSESLMNVPISISALGAEALTQRNIRDLEDISVSTPGLNFDNSNEFGGPSVAIRGIRADAGSATTAYYLDEMPLLQRADDGTNLVTPHVFDLERVEVLRGPQGTLYGAGSMGGAIRYITTQPSVSESSMSLGTEVSFTDGGDESYQVSLVGGTPLVDDTLGFRGGLFYRDQGGYTDRADYFNPATMIEKNVDEESIFAARGALTWLPTDELSVTPSILYQKGERDDRDLYWDGQPRFVTLTRHRQPEETEFVLANLKVEYQFEAFTVTSVTSITDRETNLVRDWTQSDSDALGGAQDVLPDFQGLMYWDVDQKAVSQEIRFASQDDGSSDFSWLVGLYYQNNDLERTRNEYQDLDSVVLDFFGVPSFVIEAAGQTPAEFIFGSPSLTGPESDSLGPVSYYQYINNVEEELALFANVTYRMSDELSLNLGARFSKTEFDGTQVQDGPWVAGYDKIEGSQKEEPITPRVNVTYEPSDDNMFYATAAKGFRIGGTNQDFSNNALCAADLGPEGNPTEYASDELWSYEIGTKNRMADGRAQFTASVFHIDWTDIQRTVTMPTCLNIYTDNLGEATVDGFDAELEYQLSQAWRATIAVSYTKGEFSKDTVKFGELVSRDGQEFDQPKFMGSASLYYNGSMYGYDTYGNLTVNYTGSYTRGVPEGVAGADATPDEIRDAESVAQASARAGVYIGSFDMSLFVDNLTNSAPELGRTPVFGGSPVILERSLRPRTVGLALNYAF